MAMIWTCKCLLVLLAAVFTLCKAQENASAYVGLDLGPYLHIYPPAEIVRNPSNCTPSDTVTCPLYIAVMMAVTGDLVTGGTLPGVQIALDQINDNPTILPGYKLHYLLTDSRVSIIIIVS